MRKVILLTILAAGFSWQVSAQNTITPKEAGRHIGEKVSICGKVTGTVAHAGKGVVYNLAGTSGQGLNVMVRNEDKRYFNNKPEDYLYNKQVCLTGSLIDDSGKPELILRRPEDIKVDEPNAGEFKPFDLEMFNRFFYED
jgi:micrococcal nuclease